MARAALQLSIRDLAKITGIAPRTISRFETGKSGGLAVTIEKLRTALEKAGVEFIPENGGGPGVRLKAGD